MGERLRGGTLVETQENKQSRPSCSHTIPEWQEGAGPVLRALREQESLRPSFQVTKLGTEFNQKHTQMGNKIENEGQTWVGKKGTGLGPEP